MKNRPTGCCNPLYPPAFSLVVLAWGRIYFNLLQPAAPPTLEQFKARKKLGPINNHSDGDRLLCVAPTDTSLLLREKSLKNRTFRPPLCRNVWNFVRPRQNELIDKFVLETCGKNLSHRLIMFTERLTIASFA